MRIVVLLGAALSVQGCAYRLNVESLPQPALVELPNGTRVTTPGEAEVVWAPFNKQVVRVVATGYRPLEVDLRKDHVKLGRFLRRPFQRTKGEVEFVLIPTHGATGTWSETDVPD